jgi:hypothetical protein
MLLEFLGAFFALDFAWIINFILGELFWLFALAAAVANFYPSKKFFWGFVFVVFMNWALVDLSILMGWTIDSKFGALFLMLIAVPCFAFLEKNGKLSKWNLPIQAAGMVAIWALLTLGL